MRKLLSQAVALLVVLASVGTAYAAPAKAKKSVSTKVEQTEKLAIAKANKAAYETLDLAAIEKSQLSKAQLAKASKVASVKPAAFKAREAVAPIVPPVTEDFTEEPGGWVIIDANEDGKTWAHEPAGVMDIGYNSSLDMDDWLITAPLQLEGGKMYPISLDAWSGSASWLEKVEICMGTAATAEAMTTVIVEPTTISGLNGTPTVLEGELVPATNGVYYVGIHGCSDADKLRLTVDNLVIGAATTADGPAQISDLAAESTVDGVKITLTAPDKTVAGNPLTSLTSVVLKCNGGDLMNWGTPTPGEALTYTDTEHNGFVTYTAIAYNADGASKEASVKLFAGSLIPPFTEDFENQGNVEAFTIIDANGDNKPWTWYSGTMRLQYNMSENLDDWLITPAIKLEGGKVYEVSMDTYGYSTNYPERVEVFMGNAATVEAMTKTVIPTTDVIASSEEPMHISGFMTAATDGLYYVGIHGCSDPDQFYLYIDNLSVSAPIEGGAPQAVADLTVTPDPMCELKATVAFTAPTLNIAEQPVDALTAVEIYRGETLIVTKTDVNAGDAVSYVDNDAEQGMNTYTVIVKNAKGSSTPVSASAFVGVPAPADVENLTYAIGENDGQVILTWDPVTTSVYGDPLASQFVTYTVAKYENQAIETVAEGLTECTYTVQVCDPETPSDFYQYLVLAVTDGGTAEYYASAFFAAGKPESLPWIESFADGTISHALVVTGDLSVQLASDETFQGGNPASVDGDNGFILFTDPYQGWFMPGTVGIMTALIDIPADSNPALCFSVFNISEDDENYLEVSVNGDLVKTVEPNEGDMEWKDYTVDLAAYKGKTISIEFMAYLNTYIYLLMDNIVVLNVVDDEVVANAINAPAAVKANQEFKITVDALNMGNNAQAIDVTLYKNGEVYDTATTEELAFMESETVTFDVTLSPIEPAENKFYAVVEGQDTDEANNQTKEVTVLLSVPSYPTPTEAVAEGSGEDITVTWTEPAASAGEKQPVTEDFEDATSFAQVVDGWTIVDGDLAAAGGIEGMEIPGIEAGVTPVAWFVMDGSGDDFNQSFESHSGNKHMSTMFNYHGEANDEWMISPALCGDAQTISLWAKSYTTQYGEEKLELLYTTAATVENLEDFTAVKTVELPDEWTEVEFMVPAGAKYFALHCVSQDVFMLFVDDVTYIPADAETIELELLGYNVYRNGELITDKPIEETSYVDTDVEAGEEYTYVITAVYAQGESAGSNAAIGKLATAVKSIDTAAVAISTTSNSIIVANANGQNVTISAVDGKVLYNAAGDATIPATKGIYVVKVGKKVAKVIVR